MREEFLKRWELISGTRIDATRVDNSRTAIGRGRSFDDEMLKKMGEDYAGYIGPLATRLVRLPFYTELADDGLDACVEGMAAVLKDLYGG